MSKPLESMLKKFNVAPNFVIDFVVELLKSFDNGESTLKIFVDFKERFIEFISISLGASFGDLNSIIAMVFDPISMDMTEKNKKEILSFFDSLTFNGVKEIKKIVSKIFNKTPTVDLLDYALNNLKTQLKSFMNSANINDKASDLIFWYCY